MENNPNPSNDAITKTVFDKIRENKENYQFVKLNRNELNQLRHSIGQRCGISCEEDMKKTYHTLEHEVFKKRVKDTVDSIINHNWKDELLSFRIALCKEDNNFYCIDGQSTIEAVNIIDKDETKPDLLPEDFTAVYLGEMTLDKIDELTFLMNGGTPKKRWSAGDIVASKLRKQGGQPLEAYYKIKDFQMETGCLETLASYFCAHKYIKADTDPESFRLYEFYEHYTDFYREFLKTAGSVYVKNGIIDENEKVGNFFPRKKRVKNIQIGTLLLYTLDLCVYICKKHNLNVNIFLPVYNKKLLEMLNSEQMNYMKWDNIMATPKNRFIDFAEKLNLYSSVVANTFKKKIPAKVYKSDYEEFMTKKYVENKLK